MPALKNACDPAALSFTDAVRIVRRKITAAHFPPPANGNQKTSQRNH